MKNTNDFYEVWQLLNEVIYFYDEDNSNEHKSIYKPLYEAPNGPGSDTGKKATLGYYINEYIRQMGYVLPQPQEPQECQGYESYQEYQVYKGYQEQLILDHVPTNNLAPEPIDQEENINVIKGPIPQGHRKKIFNDNQIKDIKNRREHGESITNIAKFYKCSRKTIYNYLK